MTRSISRRQLLLGTAAVAVPAFGVPRTGMGIATTSFMTARRPRDTYEFLEYCHSLGASGIQASLASLDPAYLRKLRQQAEKFEMYMEVMAELPKQDDTEFEHSVRAAKDAGSVCIRTACLSGRRYEDFSSLADWQAFIARSKAAIDRALMIVTRLQIPLAIENHKDWTAQELAALMKDRSSEYLGVCLDTGNNIALLDDPRDAIETLAPYAISTHFKDMAVEPYADGFLLSEVPLGEGIVDLGGAVSAIRRARPKANFTLEMITRNPLPVPCLTDRYWTTFPDRNGKFLADTLRLVHEAAGRVQDLPRVDHERPEGLLQLEEENVKQSLYYARTRLGL
jgi:sugar phosphate isomerase/epimerase